MFTYYHIKQNQVFTATWSDFLFSCAELISENPLSLLGQYSDDEEDDEDGSSEPSKSPDQKVLTYKSYANSVFMAASKLRLLKIRWNR